MIDREHQAKCVQLIAEYQQRLNAYILTMIPNRSAADDVLQETNLVIWQKIDTYEPGTNFNAWAYKIAYFQTLAYLKKSKRQNWLSFDSELVDLLDSDMQGEHACFEEEHRILGTCLEKLNESDKTFVKKRYSEEISLKDLAVQTKRSVGALKQVMFRIRGTLKTCIQSNLRLEDV